MSSLSHEDIRLKVMGELRKSIIEGIKDIKNTKALTNKKIENLNHYYNIIVSGNDIPLIIKNERRIESGRIPDIEVFGGKIILEIKKTESEFKDGREQVEDYIEFYPNCEYVLVTDYNKWQYSKIKDKSAIEWKETQNIPLKDILKEVLLEDIKLPLSTENIKNMFQSIKTFELDLLEVFKHNKIGETALYTAYKGTMELLYSEAPENIIKILFMKHTLLEMIVAASLTRVLGKNANPLEACGGEKTNIDIVPPYLNWWKLCLREDEDKKFLSSLTTNVYSKTQLLDWTEDTEEDAFRDLYEILIEREIRRKIGEYYTPLWLVEYLVKETLNNTEIKGKLILDPFCGSGTFLINAFNKKSPATTKWI